MVGEFRDIKQIGYKLAHHLAGIILTIVGERQFFVMVKKLLAHITLHVRSHHVSLIAYIIFAQALDDIHGQKSGCYEGKGPQDNAAVFRKKCFGHRAEDLRIGKVSHTDKCGADQVNKKDRFVRRIIVDKSFQRMHVVTPFVICSPAHEPGQA